MKQYVLLAMLICLSAGMARSQTLEELKAQKKEKEEQMSQIKSEISDLQKQIRTYPGWKLGVFGTLGFNLASFNDWFKQENPNSESVTIGLNLNAFANLDRQKHFWRNSANLNLAWQKLDIDKTVDEENEKNDFESTADVLRISSLYGYRFSEKLAVSALGEYNTSVISNFNNPGILDIGIGVTWLPIPNMTVVVHPLNYHWVFGDQESFDNALGAKFVVDYARELIPGLNWKSNLTGFIPYESKDPDLTEFTWTNGLAFNVWKGLGVGFDFAIRRADVEIVDTTQSYWIFGISYAL